VRAAGAMAVKHEAVPVLTQILKSKFKQATGLLNKPHDDAMIR